MDKLRTSPRARKIRSVKARPEEVAAIQQGKREIKQGKTVRLEDLQAEFGLPTAIYAALAAALADVKAGRVTPAFRNMDEYNAWRKTPEGNEFAAS